MTDRHLRCLKAPYKCNWCGENLHDRYGRPIYDDKFGYHYCSVYCLRMARTGNEEYSKPEDKMDANGGVFVACGNKRKSNP